MKTNETWTEVQSLVKEIAEQLNSQLSEDDRDIIYDFIENNEYGVAFDWIISLISSRNLNTSAPMLELLKRVERLVGSPSERD